MALDFQLGEVIPICFYYTNSVGDPISGETIRVKAFDVSSDSLVLNNQIMVESQNIAGMYLYNWTHGINIKCHVLLIVELNTSGTKWPVVDSLFLTIRDGESKLTNTIDLNDGRAI